MPRQLDAFHDQPATLASAYRKAAEIAELDPHYPSEADRKKRAAYYRSEAERLERIDAHSRDAKPSH